MATAMVAISMAASGAYAGCEKVAPKPPELIDPGPIRILNNNNNAASSGSGYTYSDLKLGSSKFGKYAKGFSGNFGVRPCTNINR